MDRKACFEKMRDVIVDQLALDEDAITEEAAFIEDLGADSLDLLQLMTAMEDEFGIAIPDEDYEKIKTVGDVLNVIEKLNVA